METQCIDFVVRIQGTPMTDAAQVISGTWLAKWPKPWAALHGVVAAINKVVFMPEEGSQAEGSSPSRHDHISVVSGKHLKNVSGELSSHSGLAEGATLEFHCTAMGHGYLPVAE